MCLSWASETSPRAESDSDASISESIGSTREGSSASRTVAGVHPWVTESVEEW